MAYQPASTVTGTAGLNHLATVWYNRRALRRLNKKFMFWKGAKGDMIPKASGKTVQWFRYTNFAANVTASTEGTVGVGLPLQSTTVSATVAQYTDFITVSDLLKDTAIDPIVQSSAELLGYRGGLSTDTILRNVVDGAAASIDLPAIATYMSAADLFSHRQQMSGVDVQPINDDYFVNLSHPYVTFDLINSPEAGSLADLTKYTNGGFFKTREDRGFVCRIHGVEVWESTNVTKVTGTPNKWRSYTFGLDALAAVDLEGRGPARVTDPAKQGFNIRVIPGGPQIADPEGVIGGAVSYNYVFVGKLLGSAADDFRCRKTDFPSSIVG